MTIVDMLVQSSLLTVLGMGIVFSFLIVLIIFMNLTTKIIKMLGLDKDVSNATSGTSVAPAQNNNATVAAIAAAVREKETK
ncbi:MAG: OadG family protein [Treponema sp.]|jgi:oxaloacetate decarboxylase gamma subunit|nr:OadG family protein [Treponema sp.]